MRERRDLATSGYNEDMAVARALQFLEAMVPSASDARVVDVRPIASETYRSHDWLVSLDVEITRREVRP